MYYFLGRIFIRIFGKLIEGIQRSTKGLHYQVNQKAVEESANYAMNNFSEAMIFPLREDLWEYCINKVPNLRSEGGVIAEFGVWKGKSINYFAKKCPSATVFGFDSFEGLEEDWYGWKLSKGTFSTSGKPPKCAKNVQLFKGWFEDTVPVFLEQLEDTQIQILHMDADTFKPTSYVLNKLSANLGRGTIVIFDEYFGYTNWKLHEFKAWQELAKSKNIEYQYIGYTDKQVAVEIL
jgi:hypothetical protein